MLKALFASLLLAACARQERPSHESVYREALRLKREGNLQAARKLAEEELAGLARQPRTVSYYQFRLLEGELLNSPEDASKAAVLRDAPIPDSPEFSGAVALQRLDQGWARCKDGDYPRARELLDEAAAIARNNHDRELLSSIEGTRGTVFVRLGRLPEAEESYRASLRLAEESGDASLRDAALGNLGFFALQAARFDEAIGWLEQAIAQSKSKSVLARAKQSLGWCYYRLGNVDRALALFQESERLSKEVGDLDEAQVALGSIGSVHYFKSEFHAALAVYEKAVTLANQTNNKYYAAKWLNNLATTSIEMGDLGAAEKYNAAAMKMREEMPPDEGKWWPLINAARIHESKKEIAEAQRLYAQAASAAVDDPASRFDAMARLADLLDSQGRLKEAEAEFQGALRLVEHSRATLERDDSKLVYFESLIHLYRNYVEFLFAHNRPEEALLVAESSRARLLSEKMGAGPRFTGSVGALQRVARDSHTILLSYWLAKKRSMVWLIGPTNVLAFSLPPEREIRGLVESHARSILQLRDPIGNHALYDALVAPVAASIPEGARVAIVPDGALNNLNFETLAICGEKPRYWIEDVTVSVIPALGILLHRGPPPRRNSSLLLIGDPVPANAQEYPKLANAGREIANIARQFTGSEIVERTGTAARPGAYRDAGPQRFSMIHFAAHADANRESPLDSAVILTPHENGYKLYAREILRQPIQARLVTISACSSAGARAYGGEGLVGFAWAFLEAGARNVVAGLWEVDDASTSTIMERMYREIRGGQQPADALRAAKLALLHSSGAVRKPYYWAPFQTFTRSL